MSDTVINFDSFINGLATDVTSVSLQSEDGTYGLKRTDTGASVQAAGTSIAKVATGSYQLIFTDPADDLSYDYVIRVVYNGSTYYYPREGQSASILNHVFSVPVNTYYSSEAEVMRLLGESGIENMMEDWESTDTSPVWRQILSSVDMRIDQYASQRYARSAIIDNAYIRTNATYMAAHLLMMRRNNPTSNYSELVSNFRDELDQIRVGRLHIPGAATIANFAPVIRNYQMQPYGFHPSRVIQTKSTGNPGLGITYYAYEPFFYSGYSV